MKISKSDILIFLLIGLTLPVSLSASAAKEYTRVIEKEYPITRDGTVGITNRYGNVDIRTWDAQRVKIEVTIKVDARSEDAANGVFDRISVTFENTASMVKALTEITSNPSTWKSWFSWGSSSDKFEIHYVVHAPATVALELDNKYGDIFTADMKNRSNINLKYGKAVLGSFDGNLTFNLGYGKGSMRNARDMVLNLSYSDLQVGNVANVQLNAKYSNIQLTEAADVVAVTAYANVQAQKIGSLVHTGKYDDVSVTDLRYTQSNSKYTNYKIGTLHESAVMNVGYGSVKISNVRPSFRQIELNTSYVDVSIDVDDSAAFVLEANTKYCGINHTGVEMYHYIERSSERNAKGFRGSRDAAARIVANMSYGKLNIQ